jgi:hypothetical protein
MIHVLNDKTRVHFLPLTFCFGKFFVNESAITVEKKGAQQISHHLEQGNKEKKRKKSFKAKVASCEW